VTAAEGKAASLFLEGLWHQVQSIGVPLVQWRVCPCISAKHQQTQ